MNSPSWVTTADGLRLTYDDSGTGRPVLLVHGLGLSRAHWAPAAAAIEKAGYRVVRYDQRGFGEADRPTGPYVFSTLVDDLTRVVDVLKLDDFHLVGHSLGGMVSQAFALANPQGIRSLTLVSTTSHNGVRASGFADAIATVAELGYEFAAGTPEVRGRIEAVFAEAFPFGPPPLDSLRRGHEKPNPSAAWAWRSLLQFSTKDRLPSLKPPVMVMHGTHDTWIPFTCGESIAQMIPGARWHTFPETGHFPHVKHKDAVAKLLVDFFGDVDGARF